MGLCLFMPHPALPKSVRNPALALYAFCRLADVKLTLRQTNFLHESLTGADGRGLCRQSA